MKKILYLFLINLVLVLFQTSFFSEIFGINLNPNLILAFGFAFMFVNQEEEGRTSLLIGGILLDLLSFSTVGLSSLTMLVLFELSILVRKYLARGILTQLLVIFVSTILYSVTTGIKYPHLAEYAPLLWLSFFTTLFSLVFYLIEDNLLRLFTRSELGLLKNPYK